MPYSGPSDPGLPSNVKALPPVRRRQWIHVYSSEKRLGKSDGDAIRIANGVLKGERSVDMPLELTPAPTPVSVQAHPQAGYQALPMERAIPAGLDSRPPELREDNVGFVDDIMNFFRRDESEGESSAFSLRAMPDGRLRYYAIASNNYKDRGGLVFTEAGQRKYIEFVERTGKYPELWLYHARGTKFGQADKIFWLDPHIQFTTGLIDPGKEDFARKLANRRDLGMSHGYVGKHVELPDGTIEVPEFVQFEQSVLPHKAAANFGTYFGLLGGARDLEEGVPRFSQDQREFLRSVGDTDDHITHVEQLTNELNDWAERRGLDWRSIELLGDGDETPPATPATSAGASPSTSSGSAGVGGVTEDDVRRIVGEALNGSELAESVRSMAASVRSLSENADDRFARQYEGRRAGLPAGFKASARGAEPTPEERREAALAGALKPPNPMAWTEEMFGMNPLLGGANGAGTNGRNS